VLRIENLRIGVRTGHTELTAVAGVSLEVRPGEALGLVGEPGCGRSLTAMSITRLLVHLPRPVDGRVHGRRRGGHEVGPRGRVRAHRPVCSPIPGTPTPASWPTLEEV
jgi:ABC-type glutathione transport system ATPase component